MTDRRVSPRYEIVGRLRGSLVAEERVHVHNVSGGGALVETSEAWAVGSTHTVRLALHDSVPVAVGVLVRHVRPALPGKRFLMGLEFVPGEVGGLDEVARMMASDSTGTPDVEPI